MTVSLLLLVGMVVLFACGVALLLERSLTRMLLGFILVGNATNILVFFMSGAFGAAPLYDPDLEPGDYSDPLPQAFILTAIVITFGVTAFFLALIYRAWRLAQADVVEDDVEDISLRTIDPTHDDETFDHDDAGDTEFGTSAEAAVSTASIDLRELEALDDQLGLDRDLVDVAFDASAGAAEPSEPASPNVPADDAGVEPDDGAPSGEEKRT